MAKWICTVCGYVYEGENPPEFCPQCKAPASKFKKQEGEMAWAAEHVVGVAQGVDPEIIEGLRMNFTGEDVYKRQARPHTFVRVGDQKTVMGG